MTTNPNKLDWKIAATVGVIAGVGIGGFAFASPDNEWFPTPDGVMLQDNANSAPRLSAPVAVPTTVQQLASAASVTIPAPPATPDPVAVVELSAPSPIPPAPIPAPAPAALVPAPAAEPPPVVLDIDSPASPVSVVSPASPASPVSPASPSSPGSGADS